MLFGSAQEVQWQVHFTLTGPLISPSLTVGVGRSKGPPTANQPSKGKIRVVRVSTKGTELCAGLSHFLSVVLTAANSKKYYYLLN